MEQGKRRRVIGLAAGIAALATMAFGGATAQAAPQPFQATFDDAALNIGLTLDILDPPNQATIGEAQGSSAFDPDTNQFNAPADDFAFPPLSGEPLPGVSVSVDFDAVDPITGTLDETTGEMTTTSSTYRTSVSVNMAPPCVYQADLAFTTDDVVGAPFTGDPFTVVLGPPTTIAEGNLQTNWAPGVWPALGGDCATVDGLISALPGGIALANGIDLTPEPAATPPPATSTPSTTTAPTPAKKKKCKKGFVKKKVKGKKKCVKKKKRK